MSVVDATTKRPELIDRAIELANSIDTGDPERETILASIGELSDNSLRMLIHGLETKNRRVPPPNGDLEEGIYIVNHGQWGTYAYKVQRGRESGNLYAKRLDRETGKFVYRAGAYYKLRDCGARPATLEQVTAYGLDSGTCACCGAELTRDDSKAVGIGPTCAKNKYGVTPKEFREMADAARASEKAVAA